MSESLYAKQDITNSPDNYGKPNDVFIHRITLRSKSGGNHLDMSNNLLDMVIHEDMFSPCVRGSMTIVDAIGLMPAFPIVGNEILEIVFETPTTGKKFEMEFDVYAVEIPTRNETGRAETYDLKFVDRNYIPMAQRTVSNVHEGSISDIVSRILTAEESQIGTIDKTSIAKRYIIPFWTPVQAVLWMSERATSPVTGMASFLLYADRNGINFRDVSQMVLSKSKRSYAMRPLSPVVMSDIEAYITNIHKWSMDSVFDRIRDIDQGIFGASHLSIDLSTRRILLAEDTLSKRHRRTPRLNKHPIFPPNDRSHEYPSANLTIGIDASFKYGTEYINADSSLEWAMPRRTFMADLRSQTCLIDLPGDTRLNLGDIINIDITKTGNVQESSVEPFDKLRSGRFLVTAIKHALNRAGYIMTVECARDSLAKAIPDIIQSPDKTGL